MECLHHEHHLGYSGWLVWAQSPDRQRTAGDLCLPGFGEPLYIPRKFDDQMKDPRRVMVERGDSQSPHLHQTRQGIRRPRHQNAFARADIDLVVRHQSRAAFSDQAQGKVALAASRWSAQQHAGAADFDRGAVNQHDESGRLARLLSGQQSIDGFLVVGAPEFLADILIAQQTRHASKGLEVVGTRVFRGEEEEHEIDGLFIHGIKIDRRRRPGKDAVQARQSGQLGMRDGDAQPHSRRSQSLSFEKSIEDSPLISADDARGMARQFLERLFLAG